MGRQPCCDKVGLKKGPWTTEEDKKLINFILTNGQCCWRAVPKLAGLLRCGKSCRLRWTNYLRPDLKRGLLSEYEEKMVIDLHAQLGNRWSKIASHLSGRTDNEIKNHWNTHIKKKLKKMGIDPVTHKPLPATNEPPQEPAEPSKGHQEPPPTSSNSTSSCELDDQNNEAKNSMESTVTEVGLIMSEQMHKPQEHKIVDSNLIVNNGFCIDEVPLIEPHEILVPCQTTSNSSSGLLISPTSSSCSNNSYGGYSNSNFVEDLEFMPTTFDWQNDFITNNLGFWDHDFINSFDLLINEDSDINVLFEAPPKIVLDEDSWESGLL